MKKQNNSPFIIVIGIIIAVGRFLLGTIKRVPQNVILIVMALVNYIALSFVLLYLWNSIKDKCDCKINAAGIMTAEKEKAKLNMHIISEILLFICLIVGLIYINFFLSNTMNDVISIVALIISIASNDLEEIISARYYRILLKLVKKKSNKK